MLQGFPPLCYRIQRQWRPDCRALEIFPCPLLCYPTKAKSPDFPGALLTTSDQSLCTVFTSLKQILRFPRIDLWGSHIDAKCSEEALLIITASISTNEALPFDDITSADSRILESFLARRR